MSPAYKRAIRGMLRPLSWPIQGGPAKGYVWSLPTRMRFLRGTYETRMADFAAETFRPDDIFWDVGAHFGYYSLIAARRLTEGHVYSFEPSTENLYYLRAHVRWNHLDNDTILTCAVAGEDGTTTFGGEGTGSGMVGGKGHAVEVRSIDSLIASGDAKAPTILKIDVEGQEANLLRGAERHLKGSDEPGGGHSTFVISTHGDEVHDECLAILADCPHTVYERKDESIILAVAPGRDLAATALFEGAPNQV